MTPRGFALTVFLGSLIGLFSVYSDPGALIGIGAFALFNAGYAWLVGRVGSMAWECFAPYRRHQ
jgi:hypothetical protein